MKTILGLDLGTNSIGWAYVKEAESDNEVSSIEKIGVRVNPLTTDEQTNFEKGKPITTNAGRTLARSARRNLQRYKLRRENLIQILNEHHIISDNSVLAENGNKTTFETYALRNKAATEQIELNEFARVLLMINKKRGYKSSRKVNNTEEGQLIDGMEVAKKLYHEQLTPGQYVLQLLKDGKKKVPDFYRSDLLNELTRVWKTQQQFHSEILTEPLFESIQGKGKVATWAILKTPFNLVGIKRDKKRDELKLENYQWRVDALSNALDLEQLAIVLQEINGQLYNSSGYLGAISDRSKELYFNKQTVGQYLYQQLQQNPHARLKNQVFYRQDYLDEFETIWETQAKYRPSILTPALKEQIRDVVIFYQRKLKSQKGLISFCEFEQKEIEIDGKKKTVGLRVTPKSSPLFQEFKIWQILNNVLIRKKGATKKQLKAAIQPNLFADSEENSIYQFDLETKQSLFNELNVKGKLSAKEVLTFLGLKPAEWEIVNYTEIEGNRTSEALYNAYLNILEEEGYDIREELKLKLNKDDISLADIDKPVEEIQNMLRDIFNHLGIDSKILEFNAELEGKAFEQQASYQLWHLLYSYEEDNSPTGMDTLYRLLQEKFGFAPSHAKLIGAVALQDDYGSLSSKAIRKIYPFIKESEYSKACELAGYRHSKHSLTKEELASRELKSKLDILPKNSLRNPVVEKILNQMVNVVNTLIDTENDKLEAEGKARDFRFDEIRIELARELKKNAKEREELTKAVNAGKLEHEKIIKILQQEDGIKYPTRNDIIRYKLYQELKNNGYKDLYTNQYIERKDLFSNRYDIEHIIPQSRLFDDSFSNKTLVPRDVNINKGNKTAYDYVLDTFGEEKLAEYITRVENMFTQKEAGISKAKYKKLLMRGNEIGTGFIERDLRDSQYIAKKAKEILFSITRSVVTTSGSITDKLRQDWGLINVMKELNLEKYQLAGLTEVQEDKNGQPKVVIKDWTKRNDHRHHAMDALTVAFTKRSHIQYLNNLNARRHESNELTSSILAIEAKETTKVTDEKGNYKRLFKEPIPNFRQIAKQHLEAILVSHKAKNKVVTRNINKIKGSDKKQLALTPRGQMHDQTVYGQISWSRIDLNKKISKKELDLILNKKLKNYLLNLIKEKGSISKAFDKDVVFEGRSIKEIEISIPSYTQRIDLNKVLTDAQKSTSAKEKTVKNIIDLKIREIVSKRLKDYDGDFKKAFSDLEESPIWLNEEKGISIKRVTISGVKNAEALHVKKDHLGQPILDKNGKEIPVDYVSTGNNHHVAIYEDEKGNLQDNVVSFYETVARVNQGLPIVDKEFNQHLGWKFLFTMKQNEMFVFPSDDFNPKEIDLRDRKNYSIISKHLFRVQKFSKVEYGNSSVRDYVFRHHLESSINDVKELRDMSYKIFKSIGSLNQIVKVRINHLGEIIHIGEY